MSVSVIGGSLLLSGPAWWAVYVDGILSLEVALQRWLLCLVAVWGVLSLAKRMSEKALEATRAERQPVAPVDVVGAAFEKAPDLSTGPATPRDLAADVSPDVAAGVFQQMAPNMGADPDRT
ncbi:hypothetical protein GCM10027026_25070 [Myroides odoratimimus subsp. xuanwuensis]